jgi:hypothetical protein
MNRPRHVWQMFCDPIPGQSTRPYWTPFGWDRRDGRPNAANLAKAVAAHIESVKFGGVNYDPRPGAVLAIPHRAILRENKPGGRTIATWTAPPFMLI